MNNKDLIEDIKAKLKASQELPYRDGAWERFAAQQGNAGNTHVISFKRLATIAAVGLSVLAVSLYIYRSQENDITVDTQIAKSSPTISDRSSSNILENSRNGHTLTLESTTIALNDSDKGANSSRLKSHSKLPYSSSVTIEGLDNELNVIQPTPTSLSIATLKKVEPKILPILETTHEESSYPELILPTVTTLASQAVNIGGTRNSAPINNENKMSLGDKFQLGLYVSPHRTADKFDVGAGFLVSYAINSKISLRTGTSYNSYSVGVIKDPMDMAYSEKISMENSYQNSPLAGELNFSNKQQMILPNVNAVMGKVEALEIPLDVTYNFNKGFYSSAGVSYSAIINQQREAQYIENVGVSSLQDKESLIPNAAQSLNKTKVKTVKSLQDNVNPKGFSGFANFSLGKKVNMNRKMSLSVEPFVKVPLGQFRKSDLDYTNSGIRIITTF